MLQTNGDIIAQVIVRAGVTTTSAGLYSDANLASWATDAHRWAAGWRKWPHTEGRVSTTYAGTEDNSYPEGWRTDSVRQLLIGGKRYQKLDFMDYQQFKEDSPNSQDKVFSDFGRIIYINTLAGGSGTLMTYGQFMPAGFDATDLTQTTVFSNSEDEANEAIVEEMLRYGCEREKKLDEAEAHHQKAEEILGRLWQRISAEQFAYQTKDRGVWKRFDVLLGANSDDTNHRDRWY